MYDLKSYVPSMALSRASACCAGPWDKVFHMGRERACSTVLLIQIIGLELRQQWLKSKWVSRYCLWNNFAFPGKWHQSKLCKHKVQMLLNSVFFPIPNKPYGFCGYKAPCLLIYLTQYAGSSGRCSCICCSLTGKVTVKTTLKNIFKKSHSLILKLLNEV